MMSAAQSPGDGSGATVGITTAIHSIHVNISPLQTTHFI